MSCHAMSWRMKNESAKTGRKEKGTRLEEKLCGLLSRNAICRGCQSHFTSCYPRLQHCGTAFRGSLSRSTFFGFPQSAMNDEPSLAGTTRQSYIA